MSHHRSNGNKYNTALRGSRKGIEKFLRGITKEDKEMDEKQLKIFKAELEEQGLDSEQWQTWLENASQTCFAYAETLRQTEPYAHSTIAALREVEETLLSASNLNFERS